MLQLPRRPWLEEADTRAAFHHAAARLHPDAASGSAAEFAELTKAYEILREPASRLRHLLALESPGVPAASAVPAELIPLFPMIASVRESIDRWKQRSKKSQSALESALLQSEPARIRQEANRAENKLREQMTAALGELRQLDAVWPSESALSAVPVLQARLAFLEKWQKQLREALLQLDIGSV